MSYRSPSLVDLLLIVEVDKPTSHELGVVVCDDCVHDTVTVYDFITNSPAISELAVAIGLALIHLVNLSIMTNK